MAAVKQGREKSCTRYVLASREKTEAGTKLDSLMLASSYVPARGEGYRTYQTSEQHTTKQLSAGMETYLERGYRLLGKRRPMAKHCNHCTGSSKVDKEESCV
jgi:hypothetical protein